MKLIPKAKPVRIRIKSGGVECNDLNTLRKSFCVEDLQKIEPKQLIKWLNQVDGGSEIAKRLKKAYSVGPNINELESYNIFFNLHESNLRGVWDKLFFNGWKDSAYILAEKKLAEGDSTFLAVALQISNKEKQWEIVSKLPISVLQANGGLLFNMAKVSIGNSKDTNNPGFKILERLSDAGVEEAKSFLYNVVGVTTKDITNIISACCNSQESLSLIIRQQLGAKAETLPKNILVYLKAVHKLFEPYGSLFKSDYIDLIKQLTNNPNPAFDREYMKKIGKERLFLCALLEARCRKERVRNSILNYLSDFRGYVFAKMYALSNSELKRSFSGKVPDEMLEPFNGSNFSDIWLTNTHISVVRHFMRIYFRHFLEPKYFNGDLSTI